MNEREIITREGVNQIMTESHEGENIIAVALGQARRNRILEAKQARHACGGGMGVEMTPPMEAEVEVEEEEEENES